MLKKNEIDFDIIQEPWNSYELEEGILLKIRFILKKVIKEGTNYDYTLGSQNLTTVTHVPGKLKGPKTNQQFSPEELESNIINENVSFNVLREGWNKYIIEDGTRIRIKISLTKVSKTAKFDKDGNPIYIVNTSTKVTIIPPTPLEEDKDPI